MRIYKILDGEETITQGDFETVKNGSNRKLLTMYY